MERQPKSDPILHFVLDGLFYSLEQNKLTREQLEADLTKWFPDAQIIQEVPLAELPWDDGA